MLNKTHGRAYIQPAPAYSVPYAREFYTSLWISHVGHWCTVCLVEWFKVLTCRGVKCPCCFTDTPLTAPQLIQTLLTDMVLECQTCRKDIRAVEYITHQCSGEPTKAVLRRLASISYHPITIHTGGSVKHIIVQ